MSYVKTQLLWKRDLHQNQIHIRQIHALPHGSWVANVIIFNSELSFNIQYDSSTNLYRIRTFAMFDRTMDPAVFTPPIMKE